MHRTHASSLAHRLAWLPNWRSRPSVGTGHNMKPAAAGRAASRPFVSRVAAIEKDHDKASEPREERKFRYPRSLQALHMKPLKREVKYGIPSCDLQLRSYSIQPLEFFSDFALRAAYYLGLPAFGPVPLPRITERWTVPRSHFIFKKSQENFERRTLRRLIQIKDGEPLAVQIWLAYLRKHQFYGVGMKANVWEFGPLGPGRSLELPQDQLRELDSVWSHLGQSRSLGKKEQVEALLERRRRWEAAGRRPPAVADE